MPSPEEQEYLKQVAAEFKRRKPTAPPEEVKRVLGAMLQKRRAQTPTEQSPIAQLPTINRHGISVAEGLQDLPGKTAADVMQEVAVRGFAPEEAAKIAGRMTPSVKDVAEVQGARNVVEPNVTEPGVLDALKSAGKGAAGAALTGAQKAIAALQTPGALARQTVLNPDPRKETSIGGAFRGEIGEVSDFVWRNKLAAEQPLSWYNAVPHVYNAIGDVAEALTPQTFPSPQATADERAASEAGNLEARQFSREFAEGTLSDPLLPFSFALKGAGSIAGQFERLLGISGVAGPKVERAARLAQKVIETAPGPRVDSALRRVYKAAAGASADMKKFDQIFGAGSTYAGRSGAAYFGVEAADVANKLGLTKLGLPEQLARRVGGPVSKLARTVGFRPQGTYHERVFKAREAMKSKHRATAAVQEALVDYKKEVAPFLPPEAARRKELIENFVDPKTGGAAANIAPPNPAEALGLNKLQEFFERHGLRYQQAGAISKLEANPTTGRYIPRLYQEDEGAIRNFIRRYIYEPEFPELKTTSSLNRRTIPQTQRPLGAGQKGSTAPTDPHEIVGQYLPMMERAVESSRHRKLLERFYGHDVPSDAKRKFAQAFSGGRIKILDGALSLFKEQQLFAAPRFHRANVVEDTAKMIGSGFKDPESFTRAAAVHDVRTPDTAIIGTTPAGRQISAGEFRAAIRDNGFQRSSAAQDLERAGRSQYAFASESDKAAGMGVARRAARRAKESPGYFAAEALKDITSLGLRRAGRRLTEFWDSRSKSALFIDLVLQGDSFDTAAFKVTRALYDYADQGAFTQAAKRVAPFASFTIKSAENVPRIIAQRPATALLPQYLMESGDPQNQDAAPQFMSELGPTNPLGQGSRAAVGALFGALGAPIDQGYGVVGRPRGMLLESIAPPLEALNGILPGRGDSNFEPLGMMAAPYLQPFIEGMAGKSLVTKQPLDPLGFNGSIPLVPAGTPGFGAELEAAPNAAALSQYASSWLGPWAVLGGNALANQQGAYQPPLSFQRPYADDAYRRLIFSLLSLMGSPMALTDPSTGYVNAARRRSVSRAAEVPNQIRKELRAAGQKNR